MIKLNSEKEKFDRQTRFLGEKSLKKLQKIRVAIVGVGGLGSNVAMMLVQAGVLHIKLIDFDVVQLSNLPRTPLYKTEDIGKSKVEAAMSRLLQINSDLDIKVKNEKFSYDMNFSFFDDIDLIIDGLDSFEARFDLNKFCFRKKIPYIFAGVQGTSANITTFLYNDNSPCLACIYPKINDEELPNPAEVGVHIAMVIIAASIEVMEVFSIALGKKTLNGSILFFDSQGYTSDTIPVRKNKQCPICSNKE